MKKSSNAAYVVVGISAAAGVIGVGLMVYESMKSPEIKDNEEKDKNKSKSNNEEKSELINQKENEKKSEYSYENIYKYMANAKIPYSEDLVNKFKIQVSENPNMLIRIIERYKKTSEKAAAESSAMRSEFKDRYERAKGTIEDIKNLDSAFKGINAIPIVGQVIYGLWSIGKSFADAWVSATMNGDQLFASNWKPAGQPIFTGWVADGSIGDYFLRDIPVFSLSANSEIVPYIKYSTIYELPMMALSRLTEVFPYGAPVPKVEIKDTGEMYYSFNTDGNNDLSDSAVASGKVYGVSVWNPLDISPTGPRGFDPKNPRAWFAAAQAEALTRGWIRDPNWRPPTYNAQTGQL